MVRRKEKELKQGKNKEDSTIVIVDAIEMIKVQMAAVQIMLIMSAAAGVELHVGGCSPRSRQQLQRQKYLQKVSKKTTVERGNGVSNRARGIRVGERSKHHTMTQTAVLPSTDPGSISATSR